MASIIRIKRSSTSGNPSTLGAGELAYSALTDNGSNGGDRLYIGMGTETSGNAVNHVVIGGKYFTDMLDQTPGVLTASSALVVDSSKKLDELLVDNLSLNGSTVSSTGELILSSASGVVLQTSEFIAGGSYGGNRLYLPTGGGATLRSGYEGGVSLQAATDGSTFVTLNLAASGTLTIPGAIVSTSGSNANISITPDGTGKTVVSNLYIGDTSTPLSEYIFDTVGGAITAGNGISITSSDVGNTSTVAIDTSVTVDKNTAQTLTNKTLTSPIISTISNTGTLTLPTATDTLVGRATADTFTNKSISGSANTLSNIANSSLVNSSVTIGSTTVALGATSTSLAGVTQLDVDNIRVDGNTISSTDTNGNIILDPNGSGVIDVSATRITNLAEPTADTDAATKYYVDAARSGLDVKGSVKVATTANITLSNTQTIDGVALSVGDRVLVKDQSTGSENGIYVVASGSWTRASDADNNPGGEVTSGMFCFVEQGTANSDSGFVLTTNDPITLGSTALTFTLFSSSGTLIAGNGLSKNGYTLEVNVANGIEISADNVQLASTVAGAGMTYTSGVLNVIGTSNRITVNSDSIDIASTYVGQSSITTLGTIGAGTWQGDVVSPTYGGTGVNNGSKTITLGGNFTTSGAYAATLTLTGSTNVTLPTTGTLATLAGTENLSNKTFTNTTYFDTNITGSGAATSTLDGFNIDGGTY